MRIGILGTADIAFRRFLPALQKCSDITYAGIASRTPEKTVSFTQVYGGWSDKSTLTKIYQQTQADYEDKESILIDNRHARVCVN